MVAVLIQRSGPGGVVTSAGAFIPERHRWETTKYGLRSGALQAGWRLADDSEKVAQLSGGWARIVWDLLRALRAAKLNPLESSLFGQAIEESWREPSLKGGEALPFRLNLREIAGNLECDLKRLRAAHRRLLAMNLLIDVGLDREIINKDYRTWRGFDGSPLLSPKQLEWVLSIRKTASAAPPRRHNRLHREGCAPLAIVTTEGRGAPQSLSWRPPIVSEAPPKRTVPPDPHIGSAGAEELIQDLREKNAAAATHAREGLPDSDLFPIHDGPHSPTEAEALETLRLARSLLPGNSIPEEVWQSQRLASPAVWQAAIREAARAQPSGVRMFRYVLAIASRFEAEGLPTAKLPTVARNGQSAQAPRLSRREQFEARLGPFDSFLNPEAGDDH